MLLRAVSGNARSLLLSRRWPLACPGVTVSLLSKVRKEDTDANEFIRSPGGRILNLLFPVLGGACFGPGLVPKICAPAGAPVFVGDASGVVGFE